MNPNPKGLDEPHMIQSYDKTINIFIRKNEKIEI